MSKCDSWWDLNQCMCVCAYACACVFICRCTHTCVCACVCVCVCEHIWANTHKPFVAHITKAHNKNDLTRHLLTDIWCSYFLQKTKKLPLTFQCLNLFSVLQIPITVVNITAYMSQHMQPRNLLNSSIHAYTHTHTYIYLLKTLQKLSLYRLNINHNNGYITTTIQKIYPSIVDWQTG